jgi:homoserine kinase
MRRPVGAEMAVQRQGGASHGVAPTAGGHASKLHIVVPASTANLGPGFDTLALAVNLYCTLTFEIFVNEAADTAVPKIELVGKLAQDLPRDESNLVYKTIRDLWRADDDMFKRLRITIASDIPLGSGLGSSAAAIMGAVFAAYDLAGEMLDYGTLLTRGCELEGHADNLAASLLGGLVVCGGKCQVTRSIKTQQIVWPDEWCPIVVVPPYQLSTAATRAALPRTYSRCDTVQNIQKTALLLAAVVNHDEEALRSSLSDKLHEPYRQKYVPELAAVRKAVSDLPVLGTVLSGAGPSVLTLVSRRHKQQVLECVLDWAQKQAKAPEVYALEVDREGLRVSHESS